LHRGEIPPSATDGREAILARIRAANAAAGVPASTADAADRELRSLDLDYNRTGRLSLCERTDLFCQRLIEYDAHVELVPPADVSATVAHLLQARGATRLVRPARFPAAWAPAGIRWIDADTADFAALDSSDGVITAATVAIAATGTLVLQHGPGQGRRAVTLLPDYLLCIVEAAQIVETVPEAFDRLDPVRPTTFISGPSATADIEMTRIKGVHGPRFLDVIVVNPPDVAGTDVTLPARSL
jgi:L-lactate dehydrogenase complex protein LldG